MILLLLVAPVGCSRVKTKSGVIPATTQSASAPARFGILTRRAAVGPFVGEVCALTFTHDGKTLIASSHFGVAEEGGDDHPLRAVVGEDVDLAGRQDGGDA